MEALCRAPTSGNLLVCCRRQVCRCVLGALDGGTSSGSNADQQLDSVTTAVLLPSIWSAALALLDVIDPVDAWSLIGGFAQSGRGPLRRFLQGAGLGAARVVYPQLLIFLSRLPLDAHTPSGARELLVLLEAALEPLISQEKVSLLSCDNAVAAARGTLEFGRHLLAEHVSHHDKPECMALCREVLSKHILPLVRTALVSVTHRHVRTVILEQWFGLWCFLVKRQDAKNDLMRELLAVVETNWGVVMAVHDEDIPEDLNYSHVAASYVHLLKLTDLESSSTKKKVNFEGDNFCVDASDVVCEKSDAQRHHIELIEDSIPRLRRLTLQSAAALVREDNPQSWMAALALLHDMPAYATPQSKE